MKGIHALMYRSLSLAAVAGAAVMGYSILWSKQLRRRGQLLGKTAAVMTAAALVSRCMIPKGPGAKR